VASFRSFRAAHSGNILVTVRSIKPFHILAVRNKRLARCI
jgi:hypothetical protein